MGRDSREDGDCVQGVPEVSVTGVNGERSVALGINCLREAMIHFKDSNHPHTVARIRLALSSAYGARRIEEGRQVRERYGLKRRKPPAMNKVAKAVAKRIALGAGIRVTE